MEAAAVRGRDRNGREVGCGVPASQAAIEVEDLRCVLGGRVAVEGVSLAAAAGTVLGLVGPNGAGKTTVLDAIAGMVRPESGRVRILGTEVQRNTPEARRHLGIVFQENALYEELSVAQNLRFAADLQGVRDPRARIDAVLGIVDLRERAGDPVRTLSGGMQRRLCMARALLHDPPVLLLDEPTLGVDVEARHAIWEHIRGLRARGRAVLLTTNYLDEAEALCDRVVILDRGRVIADATPTELVERAGRRVELECTADGSGALVDALRAMDGVVGVERIGGGVVAHVDARVSPEALVRSVFAVAPVSSVRTTSPDLAEVFRAITGGGRR